MQFVFIEYDEFPNTDREWRLEGVSFSQINLVVGRNATGKTRTPIHI
jgi:AAA15 family ATPase/GTPase